MNGHANEIISPVLCVAGPTASGKSSLAVRLAGEFGGEIINLDSVQVYRGADIGAAKLCKAEMQGIPHHLVDCFSPAEVCDAGKFCKLATEKSRELELRGRLPVLCGGTTMYITTLFHGIATLPSADKDLRQNLEKLSNGELREKLLECDPQSASKLHINDRVRVIRAIEVTLGAGQPVSSLRELHGFRESPLRGLMLVLCWDRAELLERINSRVNQMLGAGLIEESRRLLDEYGEKSHVFRSIGYAQCLSCLKSGAPLQTLREEISVATRQFAKRQMTYWRNEPPKRGWKMLPQQDLSGESSIKHLKKPAVLQLSTAQLIDMLRERLAAGFERNEVWYVSGRALV